MRRFAVLYRIEVFCFDLVELITFDKINFTFLLSQEKVVMALQL